MTQINFVHRLSRQTLWLTAAFVGSVVSQQSATAQWPGWGGPNHDFRVETSGLTNSWPADGPKQLWSRELGAGYSGIVADSGVLYTMYRDGKNEFTIAINAATGKTVWKKKYTANIPKDMTTRYGEGPNATPIIHGGRIYTLGVAGRVVCRKKNDGSLRWSHDLIKKSGAKVPGFGFAASPTIYKNTLIVAAGGKGAAIVAFDLKTGKVKWKSLDYGDGEDTGSIYSSPVIINVDGEDQGVLLTGIEVIGFDPKTGELKWKHPHENQWKTNISMPVWGEGNLLYVTSGGEGGSRALHLTKSGNKTNVKEVWANKKMGIGQGNVIRVGNSVYGSAGGSSSAFLTSANVNTGEIGFKERGFAKAMMLHADGKFIILDENGKLGLIKTDGKTMKVLAEKKLLEKPAWTIPTLVGKTLYIRDTKVIMAIDLSGESSKGA